MKSKKKIGKKNRKNKKGMNRRIKKQVRKIEYRKNRIIDINLF